MPLIVRHNELRHVFWVAHLGRQSAWKPHRLQRNCLYFTLFITLILTHLYCSYFPTILTFLLLFTIFFFFSEEEDDIFQNLFFGWNSLLKMEWMHRSKPVTRGHSQRCISSLTWITFGVDTDSHELLNDATPSSVHKRLKKHKYFPSRTD